MNRRAFLAGLAATAGGIILPWEPKRIYSFARGGGHAIEIAVTGTYNLEGCSFTGWQDIGGGDGGADDFIQGSSSVRRQLYSLPKNGFYIDDETARRLYEGSISV